MSHGGSAQGYRTELLRFPDRQLSVIVLCNLDEISPTRLARDAADIFLYRDHTAQAGAEEGAAEAGAEVEYVAVSKARLDSLAGDFRNPKTGTIWRISSEESRLKVDVNGYNFYLAPLSDSRFRVAEGALRAEVRFDAASRSFHAQFDDGDEATFEAVELWEPEGSELIEFAGEYFSEELGTSWELVVREEGLFIEEGPDQPLAPTVKDEFKIAGMTAVFERDGQGRVAALVVDAGRVRNLRLLRKDE